MVITYTFWVALFLIAKTVDSWEILTSDGNDIPTCKENEYYNECGPVCIQGCPTPFEVLYTCPDMCVGRCICRPGYVKDQRTDTCIPEKYCPSWGDRNAVFSRCGAKCQPTCHNRYALKGVLCPGSACVSGYVCKAGYVRQDSTGLCVRPDECHQHRWLH